MIFLIALIYLLFVGQQLFLHLPLIILYTFQIVPHLIIHSSAELVLLPVWLQIVKTYLSWCTSHLIQADH